MSWQTPLILCAALWPALPAAAEVAAAHRVAVPQPVHADAPDTADLRHAISTCWNVAALSQDALKVRVTVGVTVDATGRPKPETVHLIWPRGDDDMDAQQIYDTARRAILRCGQDGLPMPAGWRGAAQRLELTFDATGVIR